MNGVLFRRNFRSNVFLTTVFLAVLTMYSFVIVMMFDPALGDTLAQMAQSMPDVFAAFGMMEGGATLLEFIANYLYGFLLVVFPLVFLILLTSRLVTRHVERGSMAYLLATPNTRLRIISTQAVFLAAALLVLVVYVCGVCIFAGQLLFPGDLETGRFLLLNVGLYGLLFLLSGVCFCSSCIFQDSKLALGIGPGLCIAFVLLQMLSQVGEKTEFLKNLTPLTLFDPKGLITGDTNAVWMFVLLYAMGLLLYLIGIGVFCKRDLPL